MSQAVYLLAPMLMRLGIDYENSSRDWWDGGGRELWESIAGAPDASHVIVDESIARSWLAEAAKLPGWGGGPEYAPHPIRHSEADPDELDL